ncbi:MAG: DUF4340 domain-containing protein [Alphaproteobacteria bacterium]|nr:MAG: DUF4340 domain-containing protein [Alphaproteobacteria bacterium]
MRPTTVLVLAGLAAASAVGAIVVTSGDAARTTLTAGERLTPGLSDRLTQTAAVEIATGGQTIRLRREGEGWVLPDLANYPARLETVRQLLTGLTTLETIEPRTRSPELHERLGLNDPAEGRQGTRVTLRDQGGAIQADIVLGKRRSPPTGAAAPPAGQEMIYVRRHGDPQSFLALGRLDVRPQTIEWAERQVADFSLDDLVRIDLSPGPDLPGYSMTKAQGTGDLAIEGLPEGKEIRSRFEANAQGRTLEALTFEDVRRRPATLPSAHARGVYRYHSGLAVTVTLFDIDGAHWATLEAEGTEAATHTTRWQPWMFRLPDWKRDQVTTPLDKLIRDKEGS